MKVGKIRKYKFPTKDYHLKMSVLNTEGKLLFKTRACKEEFYHSVSRAVAWAKAGAHTFINGKLMGFATTGSVSKKKPRFIIYYVEGDGQDRRLTRKRAAERILKTMTLLAIKQKLAMPKVFIVAKSQAIVVQLDPFYIKSPLATSAACTFIRGAARTAWVFDSLKDFIKQMRIDQKYDCAHDDADHITESDSNGNLAGFLAKDLECLSYDGFDAYGCIRTNGWEFGEDEYGIPDQIKLDGLNDWSYPDEYEHWDVEKMLEAKKETEDEWQAQDEAQDEADQKHYDSLYNANTGQWGAGW